MVKLFHVGIVSICLATMSAWGMSHMEGLNWKDRQRLATLPIDIHSHFGVLKPSYIPAHSHSAPTPSFVPVAPQSPKSPAKKSASPVKGLGVAKRSVSVSDLPPVTSHVVSCPSCHTPLAAALILTKAANQENKS